jgi:hypothetical protein
LISHLPGKNARKIACTQCLFYLGKWTPEEEIDVNGAIEKI